MGLFRRRRSDVGTFVPPPDRPLAPLDLVVTDALLIASHGVRMAVKNHLIVTALRDGVTFDQERLEEVARADFRGLAASNRAAARQAEQELEHEHAGPDDLTFPGGKPVVVLPEMQRKPEALRAVADALEATAEGESVITALVNEAKAAAWDEVGGALASRLAAPGPDAAPDYLKGRELRLGKLITEDLETLRRQARNPPDAASDQP